MPSARNVAFTATLSPKNSAPSDEHADVYLDKAAALCQRAGVKRVTSRGDTDFNQTRHLDRWDRTGHRFLFG